MILLTGDFPGSSRPRLGSTDRQVAGLWPGDWAEVALDACKVGLDTRGGRQENLGVTGEASMSRTSWKWRVEPVESRLTLMWWFVVNLNQRNAGEWGVENPCVGGSIPPRATKK